MIRVRVKDVDERHTCPSNSPPLDFVTAVVELMINVAVDPLFDDIVVPVDPLFVETVVAVGVALGVPVVTTVVVFDGS